MKDLLELRKKMKKRKPNFTRQESKRKPGLRPGWRKPKGLHSKLRLKKKGHKKNVTTGYRSPKKVRGLSKRGLIVVMVSSVKELKNIDPKTHGIIISSGVGKRKRLLIIKEAVSKNITVINIKDCQDYIKKVEEEMQKKKEKKAIAKKKKEEKEKEKAKKAKKKEEKEKKEETKEKSMDEEELAKKVEKEEKEKKKEKDKLLIKKDSM